MTGQIFMTGGSGFWSRVAACLLDKHPGFTSTAIHPHPLGSGDAALINANVARNCRGGMSLVSFWRRLLGNGFDSRNKLLCF